MLLDMGVLLAVASCAPGEELLFEETFSYWPPTQPPPLVRIWGDEPEAIETNGVAPGAGEQGQAAERLKLRFAADPAKRDKGLSYWAFNLPQPIPLVDGLQRVEVRLRTNAPVHLKIGIAPFGFIYHGPGVPAAAGVQTLALDQAAAELQAWCRKGNKDPAQGGLSSIILAINTRAAAEADIVVDRFAVIGAEGTKASLHAVRLKQLATVAHLGAASLLWSDEGRTLDRVLDAVTIAKLQGADLVALPQECVATAGEPIPGPLTEAIAAKAKELGIWVVGNLREKDGGQTYVTSFLIDRGGKLAGTYRKSHKLPDEDLALGDALPVFETEYGKVAMKIGSDRHFPEIDHCYAVQGARMIFWATAPEPLEDEQLQDRPLPGMATDYGLTYVCSRYAAAQPGYITNFYPTYLGRPIGRSYVINREGQRVASTGHTGGGVAVATIPVGALGGGRAPAQIAGFHKLVEEAPPPVKPAYAKRVAKIAAIDAHITPEALLQRLDEVGAQVCDLACTYEFVWISGGQPEFVAERTAKAKENLAKVAAKARQHHMYVMVAGVTDRLERNEAILFDREGREVWRYYKIVQTHAEQICGTEVPVYDTDFGRLGVWICADEAHVEIPRALHVQGADLLFTPTQSWGPDATYRDHRDIARAMLGGLFLVEVTHPSTEPMHNSKIIDPTGAVVAQSGYRTAGWCLATLDLDNHRPRRYAREWTPRKVAGYLPEYQTDRVPKETNDLFDVIRAQRRPALYKPYLWPWPEPEGTG